jgi:hypothetical protein
MILISVQLFAQDSVKSEGIDFSKGVTFEVAPRTGFMGSSGLFGLNMAVNYSAVSFELGASQVIGSTSNMYPISLSVLINLATKGKFMPFGSVGPVLFITVPTNTIGDKTVTTAGLNFGGGVRYYITNSFGIRIEARQYFTTIESNRDASEEILIFQEISIGASLLFN